MKERKDHRNMVFSSKDMSEKQIKETMNKSQLAFALTCRYSTLRWNRKSRSRGTKRERE